MEKIDKILEIAKIVMINIPILVLIASLFGWLLFSLYESKVNYSQEFRWGVIKKVMKSVWKRNKKIVESNTQTFTLFGKKFVIVLGLLQLFLYYIDNELFFYFLYLGIYFLCIKLFINIIVYGVIDYVIYVNLKKNRNEFIEKIINYCINYARLDQKYLFRVYNYLKKKIGVKMYFFLVQPLYFQFLLGVNFMRSFFSIGWGPFVLQRLVLFTVIQLVYWVVSLIYGFIGFNGSLVITLIFEYCVLLFLMTSELKFYELIWITAIWNFEDNSYVFFSRSDEYGRAMPIVRKMLEDKKAGRPLDKIKRQYYSNLLPKLWRKDISYETILDNYYTTNSLLVLYTYYPQFFNYKVPYRIMAMSLILKELEMRIKKIKKSAPSLEMNILFMADYVLLLMLGLDYVSKEYYLNNNKYEDLSKLVNIREHIVKECKKNVFIRHENELKGKKWLWELGHIYVGENHKTGDKVLVEEKQIDALMEMHLLLIFSNFFYVNFEEGNVINENTHTLLTILPRVLESSNKNSMNYLFILLFSYNNTLMESENLGNIKSFLGIAHRLQKGYIRDLPLEIFDNDEQNKKIKEGTYFQSNYYNYLMNEYPSLRESNIIGMGEHVREFTKLDKTGVRFDFILSTDFFRINYYYLNSIFSDENFSWKPYSEYVDSDIKKLKAIKKRLESRLSFFYYHRYKIGFGFEEQTVRIRCTLTGKIKKIKI